MERRRGWEIWVEVAVVEDGSEAADGFEGGDGLVR